MIPIARKRFVKPADNAVALVESNPYLTRLYTTISPLETWALRSDRSLSSK